MGRDKALLELGGKPLVLHAVKKLRRVCMDVRVLGSNPALEAYAPLVPDMHPELRADGRDGGGACSLVGMTGICSCRWICRFLPTAFLARLGSVKRCTSREEWEREWRCSQWTVCRSLRLRWCIGDVVLS